MASLIIGFILNMSINQNVSDNNSWQSASFQNIEMIQNEQVIENKQVEASGQSNMMNVIMKAGSDGSFGDEDYLLSETKRFIEDALLINP